MASLQHIGEAFYLQFMCGGKRHSLALGKVPLAKAERKKADVEELLALLKSGRITVPPGISVSDFMLFDGKPPVDPEFQTRKEMTFGELTKEYLAVIGNGSIEANTLATVRIHLAHLETTLAKRFLLSGLSLRKLQSHVDRRQADAAPVTIAKEIATFRAAWNWALRSKLVSGTFPAAGLVYAKSNDKMPMMTWEEIERRIKAGGDPDELWECLYLDTKQLAALLKYVQSKKAPTWVFPMLMTAAHTGMRRSELMRMKPEDVDLKGGIITVREKKRARGTRTTRRVPISNQLAAVLKEWLTTRQGAAYLFGYENRRLSVQATQKALVRVVAKSKWSILKGWHTFRHSWISIMASKGIDQRIIDDAVGHSTESQRRRYRHLFPQVTQLALARAFG